MPKRTQIITRLCFTLLFMVLLAFSVAAYLTSYTNLKTTIGTGTIDLNLNGGAVVFDATDLNLQVGERVTKTFFIKNDGTESFYYRIYLENVRGELADVMILNLYDETDVLLQSFKASSFDEDNYFTTNEILRVGETKTFQIELVFSEQAGNTYQGGQFTFDLVASAIQSKNNTRGTYS